MRIAMIVNPVGGRGVGLRAAEVAEAELRRAGWETETILTRKAGDAAQLAREAAGKEFDLVLACGGDGTFSQVVSGLLDTGVPAGLIPAGTGNDFARAIGLPIEPRAAVASLVAGRPKPVDLLEVNGGEAWAVNIIGVGFDAAVAERTNRRVRLFGGKSAYMMAVAAELIRHRPTPLRLTVDDQSWEGNALLVAVANSSSYGGGMLVAPEAKIDDGLADVVLVEYLSRLEFVLCFPRVFKGTHLSHPRVRHWRGNEVRIETEHAQPALVDGDISVHTPLAIRVQPGRALLWMPGT